ncbi:hypothetical protein [Vibrio mangrovi]|uniref:Uncharacterized protein n=1 Tax=Vibrio mangrovi TaxID=474394 RepID=A0A1Y6IYJ5_9VIBR|nr:hypothetical protein [Vibrio mangrovi]MDW6005467.1 hypothetical protein [Vibrio mangrovi]SMS02091.1 hypothetical protein VIM7927_03405 [Vibrio mangrovi]
MSTTAPPKKPSQPGKRPQQEESSDPAKTLQPQKSLPPEKAPEISRWWLFCAILILSATLFFWFSGQLSQVTGAHQQDHLYRSNLLYLEHTEQETGSELLNLLELDALTNVAGSSQFGVSFIVDMNVEVGRILNSLNRVLERGTEAVTFSLAAIALLRVIIIFTEAATPWLFLIFISLCIVWLALALFHRVVLQLLVARKLLRLVGRLFILCWLVIPYALHLSIVVTTMVEKGFSEPTGFSYFSAVAGELRGHNNHHGDLKEHAKSSVALLHKATSAKLHHKVERGMLVVIQFAIKMLLGLILLPVGLSVLLHHLLCRVLLHHLMFEKTVAEKNPPSA